jgi:hypothetical protein
MSAALAKFWGNVVEPPFVFLGLHDKPARRFFVVSGLSALGLWLYKPKSLFYEGRPRPMSMFSDSDKAVPIDWTIVCAIVGGFTVVFI